MTVVSGFLRAKITSIATSEVREMPRVYALILLTVLSGAMHSAIATVNNADDTLPARANGQCDQPNERYVNVDKTRLRYVENGAGPAVVLIHGNAGSVDDFDFRGLGSLRKIGRAHV